jgi:predicted acetyltransferase
MTANYRLRSITKEDETCYLNYINLWENEDLIIPYTARLRGRTFNAFLCDLELSKKGLFNPEHLVPDETYILVDQDEVIYGVLNLRLYLNERLFHYRGHIGYGIAKTYRKQGLGTLILQLGLMEAKKHGIDSVLITTNPENTGSKKVIKNCGGILENIVTLNDEVIERYWVHTGGSLINK